LAELKGAFMKAATSHIVNYRFKIIVLEIILLFCLSFACYAQEKADSLLDCAKIVDDAQRLQCYDKLAASKVKSAEDTPTNTAANITTKDPSPKAKQLTPMARHWDLDTNNRKHDFVLRPYRPNYMLPVTYNSSPNEDEQLDVDPKGKAQYKEAKFQISFKMKLWEDVLGKDVDVWLAYTQLAFWQLYNTPFSSPFRDTNYEPELLVSFRTDYELLGFKGRVAMLGLNHQSNGRSQPLSRSWNRATASVGLEKNKFSLYLKTWYRIPENENNDDNPDITRYMGYGELNAIYYWDKHRLAATFRNNLRSQNLGAIQLDWCFPLPFIKSDHFSGYIQYFNGYGEGLLDYNTSINRISVGFMLKDW
jgi:phospholipase A1/A2